MSVWLGSPLLLLSGGGLAAYFGASLQQLDPILRVYESEFGADVVGPAGTAVLATGITGLGTAVLLMLLSVGTFFGKRAARVWAVMFGIVLLCCCGPAIGFESLGNGLGTTGMSAADRDELLADLAAALPDWYLQLTGTFALVVLGGLLLAMFLLMMPAGQFFLPRPTTQPYPHYPQYPPYYGYPPHR